MRWGSSKLAVVRSAPPNYWRERPLGRRREPSRRPLGCRPGSGLFALAWPWALAWEPSGLDRLRFSFASIGC